MLCDWIIKIVTKYASSVLLVNADLVGQLFGDKNIIYRNIQEQSVNTNLRWEGQVHDINNNGFLTVTWL